MIFPTVKDGAAACCMQIGEAFFFEDMTGAGFSDVLGPADSVLAIDADEFTGLDTKFLNFGGENGGFIVTPAVGSSTIDSFQVSTANDFPERDPATWQLFGTDDPISSVDTGQGDGENWTLIDSGMATIFWPGNVVNLPIMVVQPILSLGSRLTTAEPLPRVVQYRNLPP
jgi:hypothetical protein